MAQYDRKDRLYRQAKEEGYRSRAAYKLVELNKKHRLLRPGLKVLDLGCFPGGWLQVAAKEVGPKGLVVGVDLRETDPITQSDIGMKGTAPLENVKILCGDLKDTAIQGELRSLAGGTYDLVLCDMSPHLSGIVARDAVQTAELVTLGFEVAHGFLRNNAPFIAKAFPSQEIEELYRTQKKIFRKIDRTQLQSSRSSSNEFYIIAWK